MGAALEEVSLEDKTVEDKLIKDKPIEITSETPVVEMDVGQERLKTVIIICFIFFLIELIGGFMSNSLALVADSFHLLADIATYGISLLSIIISRRKATKQYSYGYHRIQVLGALTSISTIWSVTSYLTLAAWERLWKKVHVDAKLMFVLSTLAVIVNIILFCTLNMPEKGTEARSNINIRAAVLHALGDTITAFGVLISSIVIMISPQHAYLDAMSTFLFAFIVLITTYRIGSDIYKILMQTTPISGLHIEDEILRNVEGIQDIHDFHCWSLTSEKMIVSMHIIIGRYEDADDIRERIIVILQKIGVFQFTIQVETEDRHCAIEMSV
jgi:cation diffusion facilitator family transporter